MAERHALGVGIGGEAVLSLGDADRKLAETFLLELGEAVAHALVRGDVLGAVDLPRDGARLVPQRHVVGIERLEIARLRLDGLHHGLGELGRARAALRPMIGQHAFDAERGAKPPEQRDLGLGVAREAVDRDHHRHAVFLHVLDMALEIGETLLQAPQILLLEIVLGHAAMHLERADGGDDHHASGLEPRLAAFDVEEFLGAEIGAEAGLGHHIVGELERGLGGDHRVAAMRDIGERTAMDEGRVVLERLHQIRRERILEQRRHRARGREILGGDGLLVARLADLDLAEPPLEIVEVAGQAEDRHHLRGDGDVEAGLARIAVGGAAERGDDRRGARGRSCRRRAAR